MIRETKYFRFGPVRQERGSKHLRAGDLLEAINVRQTTKGGVYGKRRGFARTAQTFSGGTLSGTPETVLPGTGTSSLMRDTGDQLWARASGSNQWQYKGTHKRPWPTTTAVQSNLYTAPQPFSVLVGANIWTFALTTNAYEFSIYEASSGVQLTGRTTVTATAIVNASAAYDGTYVWVFWVENTANGRVMCHKITAATPTVAPVATTYYTMPASPTDVSTVKMQHVRARYFSSTAQVFVVASGGSYAAGPVYKRAIMHSVLDPATGLAVAVGGQAAKTSLAYSGASGTHNVDGLYILDGQDGSGTYWYYTIAGTIDTDYTINKVGLVKVTASTFSTCPITVLAQGSLGVTGWSRVSAGFTENGKQYVVTTGMCSTGHNYYGAGTDPQYRTSISHVDGATVTTELVDNSNHVAGWVASGFCKVGSSWYAITGYDDFAFCGTVPFGAESLTMQRSYHLREFVPGAGASTDTFNAIAQFDVGDGPALYHRAAAVMTIPSAAPTPVCVSPLFLVGTDMFAALAKRSSVTGYVDLALAKVETAKVYGKCAQAMGRGFAPGNIPVVWDAHGVHEIAPMLNPPFAYQTAAGAGTDFAILAVVYAFYDADGTVWRSSPFIVSATIGHGASYIIPSPRIYLANAKKAAIEIYLGTTATAKLQISVDVAASSLYYTFTTPTAATIVNGEILYTTGGGLSQTWPVACQAIGYARNRVFLAQKNRLWASKELEQGFGPLWNEVQTSLWSDVDTDITAIAQVDANYVALLANSGAAVVSGPGPDGIGNGNYTVQSVQTRKGLAIGGVAAQGPMGCYFRDSQTSRICAITPGLVVAEAAGGAYDYSAYSITSIAWCEEENLLIFIAAASNAAIVIDYNHTDEAAPGGQVYLWTFAALFAPTVACRDSSGLLVINASGDVFRQAAQWVDDRAGGQDSYRMKLTTGELQLANLQGAINVDKLQVLMTMRGASGVTIDVFPGYSSTSAHTKNLVLPAPSVSGDPEAFLTRPSGCARVQSIRTSLTEDASITSQSFEFEGIGVEYTSPSRMLRPASTRVI